MHSFSTTTLAVATLLVGANAGTKDCFGYGGLGKVVDWHANTKWDYRGGNVDAICDCLDGHVNIAQGSCVVKYEFPDKKSAWGQMQYCKEGQLYVPDGKVMCGEISESMRGFIMSAGQG